MLFVGRAARKYRLFILSFSVFGHIVAVVVAELGKNTLGINPNWYEQFPYLWIPMLAFSFSLFFIERNDYLIAILVIRFFLFIMLGLTAGTYKEVELILLCTVVVEAGLYLKFPTSVFVSVSMVVVSVLSQRSIEAWREHIESFSSHDFISYTFYSIVVLTSVTTIKVLLTRHLTNVQSIKYLDDTVKRLSAANIDFQQYMMLIEKQSTIEERNRISREIHDIVGYTLTNIKMMMEAATRIFYDDPKNVFEIILQTRDQSDSALNETRMALRALRSMNTSELTFSTINTITKAFETATGVDVQVEYGSLPNQLGDDIKLVLYRLIQEGMTNSFRHGRATKIKISFGYQDDQIHILMRDNGHGASDIKDGIGFSGMRERLTKFDGSLEAKNVVNGFELIATIPYATIPYKEKRLENQSSTG